MGSAHSGRFADRQLQAAVGARNLGREANSARLARLFGAAAVRVLAALCGVFADPAAVARVRGEGRSRLAVAPPAGHRDSGDHSRLLGADKARIARGDTGQVRKIGVLYQ